MALNMSTLSEIFLMPQGTIQPSFMLSTKSAQSACFFAPYLSTKKEQFTKTLLKLKKFTKT